jgi:hypothetical protein
MRSTNIPLVRPVYSRQRKKVYSKGDYLDFCSRNTSLADFEQGRYEVIAARDAADILREVMEKHMPDSDKQMVSADDDAEGQASE